MKKFHVSNKTALAGLLIILVANAGLVFAEIPLPEHPRPDFKRITWVNLNGQWDFAFDRDEIGEKEGWFNDTSSFDRKIIVPFSWAAPLSGIAEPDIHVGWYARSFKLPEDDWPQDGWRAGKHVYLIIGASDFGTKVWLNGKVIGEHEGGYTPFEFDLTDALSRTGDNKLVIRVEDKGERGRQVGKQNDYGPAKGIWQTVYLEARPETYIKQVYFTPDIDNKKVSIKVELSEAAKSDLKLFTGFKDESVIASFRLIPAGQKVKEFDVAIPEPRLWTLDDPYLYDVGLILMEDDARDDVNTYFGMRKISTGRPEGSDDMYVMLNDKAIYLEMALDQAFHPEGFYTFPSDEFVKEEVLRAKDIGLNGLRIHIKTGLPRKLYWADKLGVLIQSDVPNFWGSSRDGIVDENTKKNWEYTALNQIMRDYNHPSIFSWVLFNETWGLSGDGRENRYPKENQEWVRSLYYWAKELDPTRLVEDNSPDGYDHIVSDINCWHRYLPAQIYASFLDNAIKNTYPGSGWNYTGDNKQTDIPLLNTECGSEHGYRYGTGDIDLSFEYHIMVNEFRRRLKNTGFVFTQFHDVIDEWNGYYRYDRDPKQWGLDEICPGMTIKDFHSDMYVIPGDDFFKIVEPGASFTIPITASFTTDDLPDEMTVKTFVHGWNRLGEHKDYSTGQFTIKPKPYSVLDIKDVAFKAPDEECLAVMCTQLIDDNGKVHNRNFVTFRVESADPEPMEKRSSDKVIICVEPDDYSDKRWSVKQFSILDGLKVWGTGTGYFEYEFKLPEGLSINDISEVEFRAELSSRAVQGKYMREGDELVYTGKHFPDIGVKAFDSGYGFNTFPMTDGKKHTCEVTITLNDKSARKVSLSDDPADHRGLLSWLNQIRPESMAWKNHDENAWELEEAGSYGYLVSKKFDKDSIEQAIKDKVLRVKLAVDESSDTSGGLAVYGEKFGRYPLNPTVILKINK